MNDVYRLDIEFTVGKPIAVAVWSGIYLYKELISLLERHGIVFDHKKEKPFTLSPILDDNSERCVYTGILEPERIYKFRFSTHTPLLIDGLREAIKDADDKFQVIRITQRKLDLTITGDPSCQDHYLVKAKIRFYPTLFKFRSFEVLYPSPRRFFASLLRDTYRVAGLNLRVLLHLAEVELVEDKTKVKKLYIGRNASSSERHVKTFSGEAAYAIFVEGAHLQTIIKLLDLAGMLGVGKNRSIGLGHVNVVNVKVEKM
jgi:CRISPR-associated endoribonuclease Cas6